MKNPFKLLKNNSQARVGLAIATCILVLIIIYIYKFLISPTYELNGVKYTQNWLGQIVEAERLPGTSAEPIIQPNVIKDIEVKSWEIIDTSQTPPMPTGIFYYDDSYSHPEVLKWGDYLIGYTEDSYVDNCLGKCRPELQSTVSNLRILNTKTGEVFTLSLPKPTTGLIGRIFPQIIDNYYFLTVDSISPRFPSSQYRLLLPPTKNSVITNSQTTIGSKIYKYGPVYITSHCYEGCFYQRVDNIQTLETSELKRLSEAANERNNERKEKLVGFTDNGEMVLQLVDSNEIIAVSLLDEKTTRPVDDNELKIDVYQAQVAQTPQQHFNALKLDPTKYGLVEREIKLIK